MKKKFTNRKRILSGIAMVCLISSFVTTAADACDFRPENKCSEICCEECEQTQIRSRLKELFFGKAEKHKDKRTVYLCPGGDAFGVQICDGGVTVSKIVTDTAKNFFRPNDKILKINNTDIKSISDVKDTLSESEGNPVHLIVQRDNKRTDFIIPPEIHGGEYKLGVVLSEGASGIGTVTYYEPKSGDFGGLGHGISDSSGEKILSITRGEVTGVILAGAVKGEVGKPGELRGVLSNRILGSLHSNTECGVFGRLSADAIAQSGGRVPLPVADRSEVKCGEATIFTTVKNGMRAEYTIKIEDINRDSTGTKSFRIKVTDEALIALTGGIVRGMSGSPIIQDGKLVGAVTHGLVANPTEGYGIFIENMLNAAQSEVIPKAA